jgi:mRNA-degrading endonuclease toxin of MazEF toxin-antitoxin module
VIVSSDRFQRIQDQLIMVVPMTKTSRPYVFHIRVEPSETGLRDAGTIMCDQPRMIASQRLLDAAPVGRVSTATMSRVDMLLRALLDL